MITPHLSVVVVSYRCADHLAACLASLQRQRPAVRLEVIVVDNASGDRTPQVARDGRVDVLVERTTNGGFARAVNEGIARARADTILVLNPDTIVPAGSLAACLRHLEAHPDIGILTARVIDSNGRTDPRCHRSFPTAWSAFCFVTGLDRLLPGRRSRAYLMRDLPDHQTAEVDAVSGAFMMLRRDVLQQIGGFDQQFFMYAEDIDLCMRARYAGWKVTYWPGATVVHAGGGSGTGGRRTRQADAAAFRTMAPLIRKHRRGPGGWLLALTAAVAGEVLLAASTLRRRAYS